MSSHDIDESVRHGNGVALCLSGGGFRATLFHLGALHRLNQLGVLAKLGAVSSVSGGSIINGVLASQWTELARSNSSGVFTEFERLVAEPIRAFCKEDLRTSVLLWDRINPVNYYKLARSDSSVTDLLAKAYADSLPLGIRVDELPQSPRFIFCATNMETGVNWTFGRNENGCAAMGDYLTGEAPTGELTLATAVAASSAFPITFPPLVLKMSDPSVFRGGRGNLSHDSLRAIPLTDGGVYDNLGMEPVWKSHELVLVSDAGMPFVFNDDPKSNVFGRLSRSYDIAANQIGALRKRWLIERLIASDMRGTYWGISSDHEDYGLNDSRGYSNDIRQRLANVRTDLDAFSAGEIGCLENHGYALADVALRRWASSELEHPDAAFGWPHPGLVDERDAREALAGSDQRGILADIWRSIGDEFRGLLA